mmetsp:Transcript_25144/g.70093  ORF Transcript_25144/g.70093 Transcript_25144/m.70093 type:complete len:316 (-) Transcript_25144:32-979(-)
MLSALTLKILPLVMRTAYMSSATGPSIVPAFPAIAGGAVRSTSCPCVKESSPLSSAISAAAFVAGSVDAGVDAAFATCCSVVGVADVLKTWLQPRCTRFKTLFWAPVPSLSRSCCHTLFACGRAAALSIWLQTRFTRVKGFCSAPMRNRLSSWFRTAFTRAGMTCAEVVSRTFMFSVWILKMLPLGRRTAYASPGAGPTMTPVFPAMAGGPTRRTSCPSASIPSTSSSASCAAAVAGRATWDLYTATTVGLPRRNAAVCGPHQRAKYVANNSIQGVPLRDIIKVVFRSTALSWASQKAPQLLPRSQQTFWAMRHT